MNVGKVLAPEIRRPPGGPSVADTGPDPPGPHDGGGDGEWALLTTAKNSVIAALIEGRLTEEDIPCLLDHFDPSPGAWLKPFGDPLAPVRIYVKRRSLAAASILLHEIGHHPPDPSNEGPRVVKTMWWVTILVIIGLTLMTLFDMFYPQIFSP